MGRAFGIVLVCVWCDVRSAVLMCTWYCGGARVAVEAW